jgi:hypothetical protein
MGKVGDSGKDAITIAEGSTMIFDHVSVSWGRDETFSISGTASNITIQNTIIAQGLETHSCGGLIQTGGGVSLFRNLYIDNKTRNPKVKGVNDFTNNVVYNWGGGGGYIAGDSSGDSCAYILKELSSSRLLHQLTCLRCQYHWKLLHQWPFHVGDGVYTWQRVFPRLCGNQLL